MIAVAACLVCACGGAVRAAAAPAHVEDLDSDASLPAGDLESLLRKGTRLATIVDAAPEYRLQVLVSVPAPNGNGWLKREGFRVDDEYFYPASAIKLCAAVAALEVLTELRESATDGDAAAGLDPRATLLSESAIGRRGGSASLAMLVQGSLIMSDNDAHNALFDLAGHDGLHSRMWRMGLSSVRVRHRLGVAAGDDGRSTPSIVLMPAGDRPPRQPVVIPAREGSLALGKNDENGVRVGTSHISGGRVLDEPLSFESKNRISLVDLQDLLVGIVRPDLRSSDQRPHLGEAERSLLVESLTTLPSRRGAAPQTDAEHKPILVGVERVVPRRSLTVTGKGGRAFGFIVANTHVVDTRTGRSFFVTATLYTNANGRLNDDLYEYKSLAFPLLAELGEVIARSVFENPS